MMTPLIRFGAALSIVTALASFVTASPQNSCGHNQFWYDKRSCCLPNGGLPSPPSPPDQKGCPNNGPGWYWHPNQGCCVPSQPSPPPPTCGNGYNWDDDNNCCSPPTCKNNEFWYPSRTCCLPNGGPPSSPGPPPGKQCPGNNWYWHQGLGCCAPNHPNPPPPTCNNNWSWDGDNFCCNPPPPKPSGHSKRSLTSRTVSLCPAGLQACPIPGIVASGDYECIDTDAELESCGGCASIGEGQDCTAIAGAWNVGCENGTCAVYTCAAGYRRAPDGKSCLAL